MTFPNLSLSRVLLCFLTASPLAAQARHLRFSPADAVKAEWERRLPTLSEPEVAQLPKSDLARWERARWRIGQPGTPDLLPAELASPTTKIWEEKARVARTPQERFTALFMLNRLKSDQALTALAGLTVEDAQTWPRLLHLENPIAAARLNGAAVSPGLRNFQVALQTAGKVDPVRAQAARIRLRLFTAGREQALLEPVGAGPGGILALLDAANRGKWETREACFGRLDQFFSGRTREDWWTPLGLTAPSPETAERAAFGMSQRLREGLPNPAPAAFFPQFKVDLEPGSNRPAHWKIALGLALGKFPSEEGKRLARELAEKATSSDQLGALLPAFRTLIPETADRLRSQLLRASNPIARATAIEDLPAVPEDLEMLAQRCFQDTDLEPTQAFIQAMDRWKLPAERRIGLLAPFLQHPDWGWRYQAYLQIQKLDPNASWPVAPAPRPMDSALLKEAQHLATAAKPVRLRILFSDHRSLTLRLDPTVAPINVANLKRLAEQKYFDGHRVPRIVPDFVVQMGSPYDTTDGGPGYTVRCENSLNWYGPGSVGMALAGKDTGGCQFFITTNAAPHLTGKFTRVGDVEDLDRAMKILDDLELGAKIVSVRVVK